MASEPAMSGEIPSDGVLDILREIEARRITGRLRFTAPAEGGGSETGEVDLIGGQIALDQDSLPDGTDPVERLLALRAGLFVVHQRLPALPVSHGDDMRREGSLSVHVPADLMNYCEQAGLTGTLTLDRDGGRVELVYEAGELLAIRIDGREDGDLSHVFGWDEGLFAIAVNAKARTLVPEFSPESGEWTESEERAAREPTTQYVRPRDDDTGRQLMKVLEVALTTIVDQSERARPAARTSPSRSGKSVRPRPPTMPPLSAPKRRREPTVRVVYLKPDDPTTAVPAGTDLATRHVAGAGAREEALPEAQPSRRRPAGPDVETPSIHEDSVPAPRHERASRGERAVTQASSAELARPETGRGLGPLLWVITLLAIALAAVALLTQRS